VLRRSPEALRLRWDGLPPVGRGAALVSGRLLTFVLMAILTKVLGESLPSFQILFFRSAFGFFLLPL
jgi:hypothetical protein